MNLLSRLLFNLLNWIRASLHWWGHYGLALFLFSLAFVMLIPSSSIHYSEVWDVISVETARYRFDFLSWEFAAIGAKAEQVFFGQAAMMNEESRSQFLRDYMADLRRVQNLEAEIATAYNDPNNLEPAASTASQVQERDGLRSNLLERQTIAEAIIEGQVASILVEEGFGYGGQLFPPMAMRFTGMPNLIVTSPRETIRMENSIVIDPLSIDELVALEDSLMERYEVSALVVPLGGIALYPAMIHESSNLGFVIETFAHEWLHHYLYLHPLGISYFTGDAFAGEARIINETTADLFGKEIAALVIARYYPELPIPQLPTYEPINPVEPDPNAFNFGSEMNETRVRVDELLAAGQVEEAESYMEERRIFFYENGFSLRRLNQAFFAFYGGYQAGGGVSGAGGADPIGPTVITIRRQSATVYDFVQTMQDITSRETLLRTQEEARE